MEKLKKGEGLRKDQDHILLANTYNPDDVKDEKSNIWRQKENNQTNKGLYFDEYDTLFLTKIGFDSEL